MNTQTKKILIYGSIGTGIIIGGVYVYYTYFANNGTPASSNTSATPINTTNGLGSVNYYTPNISSGSSTPNYPVTSTAVENTNSTTANTNTNTNNGILNNSISQLLAGAMSSGANSSSNTLSANTNSYINNLLSYNVPSQTTSANANNYVNNLLSYKVPSQTFQTLGTPSQPNLSMPTLNQIQQSNLLMNASGA